MSLEIHWHEGLFLQPHHLQRMQRSVHDQIGAERRLASPFPYGLIEARLSRGDLENQRIRFERLRAIMPSGQILDYPGNAEIPSLDIKQALAKSRADSRFRSVCPVAERARQHLCQHRRADTRVKMLYRTTSRSCR